MPRGVMQAKRRNGVVKEIDGSGCPCCGQTLPEKKLFIDLETNTAAFENKKWRMFPKMTEFMHILNVAAPRTVRDTEFVLRMWGGDSENGARQLAIYAHYANLMLAPLQMKVHRTHSLGFRIGNYDGSPIGIRAS